MYINNVDRTKSSLQVVCPDYFEIYSSGDLKLMPNIDRAFVDSMHERNVKVTPFLTNHWDRSLGQAALKNKVSFAAQLASAVSQYGFDGVNIDIENLTDADRDQHTDFIRLIRQSLPAEKSVSIAVAANPYGVYYGWAGSYDYKVLGDICDSIFIMAYDEHYYGDVEGPVASVSFVENSLKYALKMIPANKILLGVPFYGRYWKKGAAKGGSGITNYDIESIINKYNGSIVYDSSTQTARVSVTIGESDQKPVLWGGNTLGSSTYNIYYDNEQALKYKLYLVQKYGLQGAGSWCLGQESLSTWDYFSLWLNGKYFSDIMGHYAQDYILAIAQKGWMNGVATSSFAPLAKLTRAEAATIMVRALGLEEGSPAEPFYDTTNHAYRDIIGIARRYQIMLGDGNNYFRPDTPLSREEMALVLDRVLVLPNASSTNPFTDVSISGNPISYNSIMRLYANGITKGTAAGIYDPKDYVTRGEMAAFVIRGSQYLMTYPAKSDPNISSPQNITEPR